MTTIRFTTEDLELFGSASHDRNPLHMSAEYARKSAYGSRVVFGILNTIMALGQSRAVDRSDRVLSRIECEFFDVALLETEYSVSAEEPSPMETTVRVSDGRRPVLEVNLTFLPGNPGSPRHSSECAPTLGDSRDLQRADLDVGRRVCGRYSPTENQLAALRDRAALRQPWATAKEISALLWASYLVGMELPGKRALFARLSIEFEPSAPVCMPFEYQAEVKEISELNELTIEATLASGGQPWATAQITAYLREDLPAASIASIEKLVGRSESLAGTVAFVTGGSRGLGAAIVRALALQGCTVVLIFFRGQADAESIRDSAAQLPGEVLLEQGDVADPAWCIDLGERAGITLRRLDFLVCNASPPLLPLWLEPASSVRVNQFIAKSLAMVTSPMSALLPLVAEHKGWNVLISSVAVNQIHPYFPHYATAKAAAEALVRAAAAEYRSLSSLIVRPARLLTDLTNTPAGRKGAMPPEVVAAALVRRLQESPVPGRVDLLDQFGPAQNAAAG